MTTHATGRDAFVSRLAASIADSGLTHEQIASQLGYGNPNFIGLLINGTVRLPLMKVQPMAAALGLDPDEWVKQWWEAYGPGLPAPPPQLPPAAVAANSEGGSQ